jgi:hypothetical protein
MPSASSGSVTIRLDERTIAYFQGLADELDCAVPDAD